MIDKKSLKHSILKQVILRIDYSNIMDNDIENIISSELREVYFSNGFAKFWNEYENSIDLNLPEKGNANAIPSLDNFEKLNLWCFYGENDEIKKKIKLSKKYFYLSITVKTKYNSFLDYIEIVSKTICKIKEKVSMLNIGRISMRKINACFIEDLNIVEKYFNKNVFDIKNEIIAEDYTKFSALNNVILLKNKGINVNYIRSLQKGTNANKTKDMYQIVLDLDSYINDREKLLNIKNQNDIVEVIKDINEELFDVFIRGLTEYFVTELQKDKMDDEYIKQVK